jgi:hypothetical protein
MLAALSALFGGGSRFPGIARQRQGDQAQINPPSPMRMRRVRLQT